MKHVEYRTHGTCSVLITFDLDGEILKNVKFTGGCPGNLLAISKLVEGKNAKEIANKLKGNRCGARVTSCADQLANAILENIN